MEMGAMQVPSRAAALRSGVGTPGNGHGGGGSGGGTGGGGMSFVPSSRRRPWLAAAAALNALAAWGGAIALATGVIDFGDALNERLPFDSLPFAGVALGLVVALPLTVLAWAGWTGHERTDDLALAVGVLLIGWIVVQIAVLRSFSPFQPTYLCIGIGFVAASHRIHPGDVVRGAVAVVGGAILVAAGVGLLPHLIKAGFTPISTLSVVLLAAGVAASALGVWWMARHRRVRGWVAGVLTAVLCLVVALSILAPAVAATNVVDTEIGSIPAAFDLSFENVTLRTADYVDLAAWFIEGSNRAGVVMLHGAGSTRSNVLDQAAALVAGGYAVLLVDARGHGDSGGSAMDFGWYGDLDIAAATEFLAARPDIDPGRIGLVGFSMGGEEAIGAAASDERIRAVVAEGATARTASDKSWFSEVYGWRGWLQERLESLQYGVADFLTEASPPVSLRSAVATAPAARFLLITAGNVDDEIHAAAHLWSEASDRVTVWTVPGADHTEGHDTQPEEWERRVLAFLDEHLG